MDELVTRPNQTQRKPWSRTPARAAARLQAADAMTWPAAAIDPTTHVTTAVAQMDAGGFDHLLVVSGREIGTVCRYDLWRSTSSDPVASIARSPGRLSPGCDLWRAISALRNTSACCLPVVVPGSAFGIVTARDVVGLVPGALRRCDSCLGYHRVRHRGGWFCIECLDGMISDELDEVYLDIGTGD